jgi:DNA-binding MarR family transcriptional regulator
MRVVLTARGRDLMRRAIPRHGRDLEDILSRVPASDLARLRRLLGRFNRTLEAQ